MLTDLLVYTASFIFIWIGSGMIISSTDRFSRRMGFSSFAISFVILGILTSVPELAVGLTAIADRTPEIFVGNLIGGIPVIFLFVIPILAIFGNGIKLQHEFDNKNILLTLIVIISPCFFILDRVVTSAGGYALIILYLLLLVIIERRHGIFSRNGTALFDVKAYSYKDILKVIVGIGIVIVSSNQIVEKTIYFSQAFHITTFYISLIALSVGTNLPELSLAIRTVFSGKKEIAFGDYMGSAAANTLLFGIFTILNQGEVITVNNFSVTFYFLIIGLGIFYLFSSTGRFVSRTEGIILLCFYFIFLFFEFVL